MMKTGLALTVLCVNVVATTAFQLQGPRDSSTPLKALNRDLGEVPSYSADFRYNSADLMSGGRNLVQRNADDRKPLSRETKSAFRRPRQALGADITDDAIVQGGSLRTWTVDRLDLVAIEISTQGRPMDADVELWQGPDNTPQKVKVYSEDGSTRPFTCLVETPRSPNTVAIRNIGYLEFPFKVDVKPGDPADVFEGQARVTIQGGALKTFSYDPQVDSVGILLRTDGRPLTARIEMLQGPNNNKQIVDLYSEDGLERPFYCIAATPGSGNVVRIVNTSPMEFPLSASVEPLEVSDGLNDMFEDGQVMGLGGW